ncbi:hypothetical protein H072_1074 [Dactylellina haptotyla CBS 200.50]|uniref:Uncharacterized protein n=1 Tax=Dactylellina haptotyla (strain CBS 200.50) TaxID=1284197 RepID=S8AVE4_DACHA|nr:hypothetical protein H072_1074 [Dactylellina haptotyla CBS 200.50]
MSLQPVSHNALVGSDKPRIPNLKLGGNTFSTKDLNAQEWSQAVLNELENVRAATPSTTDSQRITRDPEIPNSVADQNTHSNLPNHRIQTGGSNPNETQPDSRGKIQLDVPQRPQAGAPAESNRTINIVKKIPGAW